MICRRDRLQDVAGEPSAMLPVREGRGGAERWRRHKRSCGIRHSSISSTPARCWRACWIKICVAQVAEEGRGVFGLPILLLRWVRMPAVLLDIGSLSDPGFEAKLRDDAYLQRAALGIAQAVNDYQALQR